MPLADVPQDHLSDYERAVCYYTLPHLAHPVSLGLIMVYAFCLFETLCLIAYGLYAEAQHFVLGGFYAFIALVLIGVAVFLFRSFLNDIRTRRALAHTKGVPDAAISSLPDPFAGHVLLKHPVHNQGKLFACTEDNLSIAYFVDSTPDRDWWKITDAEDQEICRIKSAGRTGSFVFNAALPTVLEVYAGDQIRATIIPRFSFSLPTVLIRREQAAPAEYLVKGQGIYNGNTLVGRVYTLRHSLYLDIQSAHLNEATLSYFVTLD